MAFFIDDLLLLPAKGFMEIAKKIRDMADEELRDSPEKLQRELSDAQLLLETEQITGEEYQKREHDILERLSALRDSLPSNKRQGA